MNKLIIICLLTFVMVQAVEQPAGQQGQSQKSTDRFGYIKEKIKIIWGMSKQQFVRGYNITKRGLLVITNSYIGKATSRKIHDFLISLRHEHKKKVGEEPVSQAHLLKDVLPKEPLTVESEFQEKFACVKCGVEISFGENNKNLINTSEQLFNLLLKPTFETADERLVILLHELSTLVRRSSVSSTHEKIYTKPSEKHYAHLACMARRYYDRGVASLVYKHSEKQGVEDKIELELKTKNYDMCPKCDYVFTDCGEIFNIIRYYLDFTGPVWLDMPYNPNWVENLYTQIKSRFERDIESFNKCDTYNNFIKKLKEDSIKSGIAKQKDSDVDCLIKFGLSGYSETYTVKFFNLFEERNSRENRNKKLNEFLLNNGYDFGIEGSVLPPYLEATAKQTEKDDPCLHTYLQLVKSLKPIYIYKKPIKICLFKGNFKNIIKFCDDINKKNVFEPKNSIFQISVLYQFYQLLAEDHDYGEYFNLLCGYYAMFFAKIFALNFNKTHDEIRDALNDRGLFEVFMQKCKTKVVTKRKISEGLHNLTGEEISYVLNEVCPEIKGNIIVGGDPNDEVRQADVINNFKKNPKSFVIWILSTPDISSHWICVLARKSNKVVEFLVADSAGRKRSENKSITDLYSNYFLHSTGKQYSEIIF